MSDQGETDEIVQNTAPIKYDLDNLQAVFSDLKNHECRWPIGEPEASDFHFCGADKVKGRPYCESHLALAYRATPRPRYSEKFFDSLAGRYGPADRVTNDEKGGPLFDGLTV